MSVAREHSDSSYALWEAPIGYLGVVVGAKGVLRLFTRPRCSEVLEEMDRLHPRALREQTAMAKMVLGQLQEYFHGRRRTFALPLDRSSLSPFAAAISLSLAEVPFGQTVTYGELATMAGEKGAARAVGRVMAGNPFPIVVPCHRVIGTSGALTGYSGGRGIETKEWLLGFEREQLER